MLREIRELGESIICLDQHPSLISKPALGNTYTTFAFNLKHRGDIAMIQDCLHLDSEQAGYMGRLEVGWAMVKLQGRWFLPFLIKLPLVELKKGSVTDEDIKRRTAAFTSTEKMLLIRNAGFSGVISADEANSRPQSTPDKTIPPLPAEAIWGKKEKKKGCAIKLTTQDKKFLMDVWQYPTSSVTERYLRLNLSRRCGHLIQTYLLRLCFISFSFVVLPHGRMKILLLKEKGKKYWESAQPNQIDMEEQSIGTGPKSFHVTSRPTGTK